MPLSTVAGGSPGAGPFPLLVQVHGWGGDKGTPERDFQILNEGIALIRYSTRGFGESFGDNQLSDEDFEIRDIQNLVRQVVELTAFGPLTQAFSFNRKKIAITGVSYGGGHSLLLAQSARRTWQCAPDTCELVTAIPIIPWSDLIYSLIPNGRPSMRYDDSGYVFGIEKLTYVAGLFASGHRTDPQLQLHVLSAVLPPLRNVRERRRPVPGSDKQGLLAP